ncbi:NAD-P-binding protein [Peniophora sp. CONT]|nr:NAD-P-binding protein [Peniophora sp. CONT]
MTPQEHTVWRISELGKGPTALKQHRDPVPSPGPGQYLVRIHAVSLNYGDAFILDAANGVPGLKACTVPCADMAGEIIAAGERASQFQAGDKVTSLVQQGYLYVPLYVTGQTMNWIEIAETLGASIDGTLQQYRVFDEVALLRAPNYLSYDELSTFPVAATTAWNALYGGNPLIPGQTVLLQGTGGVSMFGLLIANAAGARTIITSSSDEKLKSAKEMGATHTINYRTTPEWDEEVRTLTNGTGAHHILDTVGVSEIERCFNCVAAGGVITTIGILGGMSKAAPNVPLLALFKQASLRGIRGCSKQEFEKLLRFAEFSQIRPRIDRIFAFEKAVEAFQYLKSGQHFGKVVIHVSSDQ